MTDRRLEKTGARGLAASHKERNSKAPLRTIGKTSVRVSAFSLGTTGIGNYPSAVTDEAAFGTVAAAIASGFRMFDTAPLYGRGLAERRLGLALKEVPRNRIVVGTKVGRLLVPCASRRFSRDPGAGMFIEPAPFDTRFDYSYDGAMRSIEDSLQRLGLPQIDIVHIHNIDPANHPREKTESMFSQCMAGAYKALDKLRNEGVIRAIGVGNNSSAMLQRFAAEARFDCFLMAGQYNLLDQTALDGLLDDCGRRGISVLLGGVFASGILATGSHGHSMFAYAPADAPVRRKVAVIEALCATHNVSLPAAAVQFALAHPVVRSVVVGCVTAGQVIQNSAALREPIPDAFWTDLLASGLVNPHSPIPSQRRKGAA